MRTSLAATLSLLLALSAARAAVAQAPAFAKAQGLSLEQVEAAAKKKQQQQQQPQQQYLQAAAYQGQFMEQNGEPVQQAMLMQAPNDPGSVQVVGYPATYPANCPPGGYGYGGHQGYGYAGHPGHLFNGGHYGYFGGAHRTPGYPHHHLHREYVGPQGPPSAQVAYPYYTTRGPRDFLMDNPPSIGR